MGMNQRPLAALALLLGSALTTGCASTYYNALENIGIEKREILTSRVDSARKAQADAQEEFKDALEQYRALVNFDGGELARVYDRLSNQYDNLEGEANVVRARIDGIENVGEALFREWRRELDEYSSADLRQRSEAQLRDTQRRYDQVLAAMNNAAERMDPVLELFEDQVLFLKHNLNAAAIAGLENERIAIEREVDRLIAEMDRAIAEADAFIAAMPRS
jgi:Skp family chaperone for outer membrane proteins